VWTVREGKLARQPVKLGLRDLLKVEVTEGLQEGAQVVVNRPDSLAEGKRVVATEKPDGVDGDGGR
jgi:HlyD family secretion protein